MLAIQLGERQEDERGASHTGPGVEKDVRHRDEYELVVARGGGGHRGDDHGKDAEYAFGDCGAETLEPRT